MKLLLLLLLLLSLEQPAPEVEYKFEMTKSPNFDDKQVELPTWGTLDRSCSWEAFAEACCQSEVAQQVLKFNPEAVLGVDWSSLPAFERLAASLATHGTRLPYIYMNYRQAFPCG